MFVIDRSLYLSPEVVGEPGLRPLKEVDPFSLEALVAWLEKQDGATEYDFRDTHSKRGGCLFARYATHLGFSTDFNGYVQSLRAWGTYPSDPFSEHRLSSTTPHTFGAAKDRARKLLAEREK